MKTALLLGATGLVGKELMQLLLHDTRYEKVVCLTRKPFAGTFIQNHDEKFVSVVVDFENLNEYADYFECDHVYVCLGTTIRQAGSQEAFRRVDFDYVLKSAQLAKQHNCQSFVWISSVGSSAKSNNFYLKVKGELEEAIADIQEFKAKPVQPSLLLGDRAEFRFGEWLGIGLSKVLSPLFRGPLAKYKPIAAVDVAKQMISLQDWD